MNEANESRLYHAPTSCVDLIFLCQNPNDQLEIRNPFACTTFTSAETELHVHRQTMEIGAVIYLRLLCTRDLNPFKLECKKTNLIPPFFTRKIAVAYLWNKPKRLLYPDAGRTEIASHWAFSSPGPLKTRKKNPSEEFISSDRCVRNHIMCKRKAHNVANGRIRF